MSDKLSPISEVIEKWMKSNLGQNVRIKSEEADEKNEQLIIACWREVVGTKVARMIKPYHFEHGILYVYTESSTWAQEISLMKSDLIWRLNRKLGSNIVSDIRCRIGAPRTIATKQRTKQSKHIAPSQREIKEIELPPQTLSKIEDTANMITDEELRSLVKRTLILHAKLKIWREKHGFKFCQRCNDFYGPWEEVCPICQARAE
ncbi:MAG: hypothetical protein RUDDFDWM_001814 [Candidatus Fervidibacterota bacterium]